MPEDEVSEVDLGWKSKPLTKSKKPKVVRNAEEDMLATKENVEEAKVREFFRFSFLSIGVLKSSCRSTAHSC